MYILFVTASNIHPLFINCNLSRGHAFVNSTIIKLPFMFIKRKISPTNNIVSKYILNRVCIV